MTDRKQISAAGKRFRDIRARHALESEDQVNFILGRNPNRPQPPEGSVIDPALNRGPLGFIEQDPAGFAKGIASSPFTAAPDILGLAQQGMNALAGPVQERLGLPQVGFDPISGDPIREAIGLDPESPQGLAGEVASPVGTMAKALGITAKSVVAGAKLAAGTNFDPSLAMTLFHGSPFKFNKFESAKIGTGEGAQAFGHGLYFAENPSVANSYKNALTPPISSHANAILFDVLGPKSDAMEFGSLQQIIRAADNGDVRLAWNGSFDLRQRFPEAHIAGTDDFKEMETLLAKIKDAPQGNLYEVEIPDSVTNRMLDWDAPLSEQPESVRRKLIPHLRSMHNNQWIEDVDGNLVTRTMDEALADPRSRIHKIPGERIYKTVSQQPQGFRAVNVRLRDGSQRPDGPVFPTRVEAKAAWARGQQPDLNGTSDEFAATHFDQAARNQKSVRIQQVQGGNEDASDILNQAGIPGIRFFDQQSRVSARHVDRLDLLRNQKEAIDAGDDKLVQSIQKQLDSLNETNRTRNIVVFNPDDITQVKRDGETVFNAVTGTPAKANTVRLFHGTPANIKPTDKLIPSKSGEFGPGVYLSNREESADMFGTFQAKPGEKVNVIQADVSLTNPFVVDKVDWIKMTETRTPGEVQKALKQKGHDGIIGIGINGVDKQYVIFDPDTIKQIKN